MSIKLEQVKPNRDAKTGLKLSIRLDSLTRFASRRLISWLVIWSALEKRKAEKFLREISSEDFHLRPSF